MKKFSFPLQAVLTLRKMRQDDAMRAYAESMQAHAKKEQEFQLAHLEVDSLIGMLNQPAGSTFSAMDQSAKLAALSSAREQLEKKSEELREAKKLLEERLKAFRTARHEAELLGRLREKQFRTHLNQNTRQEELELEELALARVRIEKFSDGPINQSTMQHREE